MRVVESSGTVTDVTPPAGMPAGAVEFKGSEWVRRALTVAAIGGHSVALFGPAGCGKSCFRELVPELASFEERPCPCGCRGDRTHECRCTLGQVLRHQRRSRFRQALEADIVIECQTPNASELRGKGWTPEEFAADVNRYRAAVRLQAEHRLPVRPEADELLVYAVRRLGFNMKHRDAAIRVATTIALMDVRPSIGAEHMAEAIQYRKRDF